MKILNKRLKGSNLSYNGISIEFDSNGISSDLEDKVAKSLATLANYELVEEPKKEEPKKEEPKKPATKRSTARKTTAKTEGK